MSLIRFQNVCFAYPEDGQTEHYVLKSVSLEIDRGEFVALIGRNASGKSTLAKLAAGLLQPTSGRVLVDGRDTREPLSVLEIRRKVSLVLQDPDAGFFGATVEEDVAFGPCNLGISRDEVRRRVKWAMEVAQVSHLKGRDPHGLSGGEKYLCAIASALAMTPDFLILDEATCMLDRASADYVHDVLLKVNKELGTGVMLITHDMDEAMRFGRVIALTDGSIFADGCPEDVFAEVATCEGAGLDLPYFMKIAKQAGLLASEEGFQPLSLRSIAELLCGLELTR